MGEQMECRINYCWRNNRRTIDCKLMIVGHILLGQMIVGEMIVGQMIV